MTMMCLLFAFLSLLPSSFAEHQYCKVQVRTKNLAGAFVGAVHLQEINEFSTCVTSHELQDHTDLIAYLEAGKTYEMVASVDPCFPAAYNPCLPGLGVPRLLGWIDYNNDGTFDADEQMIFPPFRNSQNTVKFTVPSSFHHVERTRMRLMLQQAEKTSEIDYNEDPCRWPTYGAVKDFSIASIEYLPSSADAGEELHQIQMKTITVSLVVIAVGIWLLLCAFAISCCRRRKGKSMESMPFYESTTAA